MNLRQCFRGYRRERRSCATMAVRRSGGGTPAARTSVRRTDARECRHSISGARCCAVRLLSARRPASIGHFSGRCDMRPKRKRVDPPQRHERDPMHPAPWQKATRRSEAIRDADARLRSRRYAARGGGLFDQRCVLVKIVRHGDDRKQEGDDAEQRRARQSPPARTGVIGSDGESRGSDHRDQEPQQIEQRLHRINSPHRSSSGDTLAARTSARGCRRARMPPLNDRYASREANAATTVLLA
jgi:hypothetical protein